MSQERRPSREERVSGLIRVGELELTGENEAEVDAYFAPEFVFHGPDGAELDYEGLKGYFASLRAAFDDLIISRRRLCRVPDDDRRDLRAGVHAFTGRPASPEWQPGRLRTHEHLPVRRPRTARGGMGPNGQPQPAPRVGR
jgi:hypothetical protein